jgi:hypothetical protein
MESTAQPFLYTDAVAGARPDIMLLLTCARFQLVGRAAEQIRTVLRQELDGPAVVQLALKHGVMPLVYRSLSSSRNPPQWVWQLSLRVKPGCET